MTPYDRAWEAYHYAGKPCWAWHELLSEHFHHGAVISTPEVFILARRVNVADADEFHLSPLQYRENGDCWMIWIAAGRLESLAVMAEAFPLEWVSYQRGDSTRLRRARISTILHRHGLAKSTETATTAGAAGVIDRT